VTVGWVQTKLSVPPHPQPGFEKKIKTVKLKKYMYQILITNVRTLKKIFYMTALSTSKCM
jgi:hypothetical protein